MKREKIEEILIKMGIPVSVKGFEYIVQAVLMMSTEEWKNPKYTALYEVIAKKNKTKGTRVERAIRYSFKMARDYKECYEIVEHYIGHIHTTNSASLSHLCLVLKREEENEESNA